MAIKPQSDSDRAIRYANEQKYKAYKAEREAEKPLLAAPPRNTSRQRLISFFDKVKSKAKPSTFRGLFIIVFAFIAFSTLIRTLVNPDLPVLSVSWFISLIQNVPQISFDWLVTDPYAFGDWGALNELRNAFYYVYSVMIQPLVVILQAILQIVGFVGYFLQQIFLLQ